MGPVGKTSPSSVGDVGLVPGREPRSHMPHGQESWPKQKQYCKKFNKDFKNGPHPNKQTNKKLL